MAAFLSSVVYLVLWLTVAFAKQCKKLDNCRCEMDDGTGIIDLNDINNKDGKPRFTEIKDAKMPLVYTYSYNPCTTITTLTTVCKDTNMCQTDGSTASYFPCGKANPTFTMEGNKVVLKYKELTYSSYTRSTEITLVCDESKVQGSIDSISQYVPPGTVSGAIYKGTLRAKSACPGASGSSGLSIGSILLIIFFPLVLLYLIFGIIINYKFRDKRSVPEVLPNHEFWADCPFLVKDGCVFTCLKLKSCCCFMVAKAKGESYAEI